ncbi:MAG TPA: energy transducer TonB [Roseomonas sp.]|jgi:protein TonB
MRRIGWLAYGASALVHGAALVFLLAAAEVPPPDEVIPVEMALPDPTPEPEPAAPDPVPEPEQVQEATPPPPEPVQPIAEPEPVQEPPPPEPPPPEPDPPPPEPPPPEPPPPPDEPVVEPPPPPPPPPPPRPTPPRPRPPRPAPPRPTPAAVEPAAPAPAAPAPAVAAPAQARTAAAPSPNYVRALLSALERHKRYPDAARARRSQGVAILRMALGPDGRVLNWRILQSAGDPQLDEAVGAMVQAASPLPAPPAEMLTGGTLELTVPVRFAIR